MWALKRCCLMFISIDLYFKNQHRMNRCTFANVYNNNK